MAHQKRPSAERICANAGKNGTHLQLLELGNRIWYRGQLVVANAEMLKARVKRRYRVELAFQLVAAQIKRTE